MQTSIATRSDFLGYGLITPFRRSGAGDFSASSGTQLVRSAIRQILSTRKGELRWRTKFGTNIEKDRNKANTEGLEALIKDDIETGLKSWEPRISVLSITVKRENRTLTARVNWQVIDRNVPGNQVLLGPDAYEVRF